MSTLLGSCSRFQISAGQLSSNAAELEVQLSQIFMTASQWKALLLLDEADVYLTQRSLEHVERNRLVATFLHKLEYFEGILFLTTNLPDGFDPAILNRVHLSLQYDLSRDGRKAIFRQFLQKDNGIPVNVGDDELNSLADVALNGRQVSISHHWRSSRSSVSQIKNSMSIACTLAAKDRELSYSHVRSALAANGHFVPEPGLPTLDNTLYDE